MKENRERVIAWIGISEGGYVNNPHDNGGETNRGITARTYAAWLKKKKLPPRSVKRITKEEADQIIFEDYMMPVRFDDLPSGLDYAVADFAVNSGVRRAAIELQEVIGFRGRDVDGIIGSQTLAKVDSYSPPGLIDAYCDNRMSYLRGLSDFKHFGDGWTKRLEGNYAEVDLTDVGVRDRAMLLAKGKPSPAPVVVAPAKSFPPKEEPVVWDDIWTLITEWFRQLFGGKIA